jgi:CubicO group peptidase (beta-lactamase class C family)
MLTVLKIFSGLITVLVLAIAAAVLVQLDFPDEQDLNRFVVAKMEVLEAKGMAVAFIRDGAISWSNNYGYADVEIPDRDHERWRTGCRSRWAPYH